MLIALYKLIFYYSYIQNVAKMFY